jgi:hypothetical protein
VKKLILISLMFLWFVPRGSCYLLVEDIPNLTTQISNEIKNFAQYVQQVTNQVTQIENQVTQISQTATYLTRLGNPNYYVNMLGLGSFATSVGQLQGGLGQTIQQYRGLANGASALSYTGGGIYQNLNGTLDRWGNPVLYNQNSFRTFGTVQQMTEDYNTQQTQFNTQNKSLLGQLLSTLQKLNAETTQIGTEKLAGQANGVNAQIIANQANAQLAGQRLQAQVLSNQNDAARMAEANRQMEIQGRQTDLANEAAQFGSLVGGSPSGPPGGILP